MLSKNTFFLSAIVGSIVHMTVGGPLDCISVKLPNLKDLGKTSTKKIPREHKNGFSVIMQRFSSGGVAYLRKLLYFFCKKLCCVRHLRCTTCDRLSMSSSQKSNKKRHQPGTNQSSGTDRNLVAPIRVWYHRF